MSPFSTLSPLRWTALLPSARASSRSTSVGAAAVPGFAQPTTHQGENLGQAADFPWGPSYPNICELRFWAHFAERAFHTPHTRVHSSWAAFLVTHHHNRAVGMPNYRVRNAAHQSSPHPPAPPAAHHYQTGPQILCQVDDLSFYLSHRQMRLCDCPTSRTYPLHFLIEHLPTPPALRSVRAPPPGPDPVAL